MHLPKNFLLVKVVTLAVAISFVTSGLGCSSLPDDSANLSSTQNLSPTHELVFGSVQAKTTGINPRGYATQVRFIALTNTQTDKRYRVQVNSDFDVLFLQLPVGDYTVDRVQFNEGPFLGEAHVHFNFHVSPGKMTYLGDWQFELETPRTIRQVRIYLSKGDPTVIKKIAGIVVSEQPSIETVVPQPDSFVTRVYSVAPYPKIKYFYRR